LSGAALSRFQVRAPECFPVFFPQAGYDEFLKEFERQSCNMTFGTVSTQVRRHTCLALKALTLSAGLDERIAAVCKTSTTLFHQPVKAYLSWCKLESMSLHHTAFGSSEFESFVVSRYLRSLQKNIFACCSLSAYFMGIL